MERKSKLTKGVVIELDNVDRANIKIIQSKYILIGVSKNIAQIASDCLKIGIANKLANTEKL